MDVGDEGDTRPGDMQTKPLPSFPVSALPARMKLKSNGKLRKPFLPDLEQCKLMELVQYECDVKTREVNQGRPTEYIECLPLVRLFRRCQNGNGEMVTVETTAWEGELKA